jgi:predicted deacetylase
MTPSMIVSLHDVAASTAEESRTWLAHLDERGVPATLLVVPGPWQGRALHRDEMLIADLHAAAGRGHEIALHGYEHTAIAPLSARQQPRALAGRLLARGCAEFATLDTLGASARLQAGLTELRSHGFQISGFTPPGWLQSPASLMALRTTGLAYTTSQWHIRELATWRRLRIPALSHRPGSSLAGAAAQGLRHVGLRRLAMGRSTRLALHPSDLNDPRLVAATLELIDRACDQGARFTTYADLVRRWVTSTRPLVTA